jgi:hypothetical protein
MAQGISENAGSLEPEMVMRAFRHRLQKALRARPLYLREWSAKASLKFHLNPPFNSR